MVLDLFEKEIERMEREVRDLKTGHLTAVGSLLLNSNSDDITTQTNWYDVIAVIIDIDADDIGFPFFQVYMTNSRYITQTMTQWSSDGRRLIYYMGVDSYSSPTHDYTVTAVCSSNFTMRLQIVTGPIS